MPSSESLPIIAGLAVGVALIGVFSIMFSSTSSAQINANNHIEVNIEGIKSNYTSGEKIILSVHAKGNSDNYCNIGSPSVYIRDNSDGKIIYWPNPFGFSTAMMCNTSSPVDMMWTYGDEVEQEIILEKAGSYAVVASLEGVTVEKQFAIVN
jgi:hypothetical protein